MTGISLEVRRAGLGWASFKNIGAIYVWLLLIAIFSIWVPSTFPVYATVKQILNEENPPPTAETLKATNARFTQLLARDSVQQLIQLLGQSPSEAILDLELNMGTRLGAQ